VRPGEDGDAGIEDGGLQIHELIGIEWELPGLLGFTESSRASRQRGGGVGWSRSR
jgi:hypothetical protein